MLGEVILIGVVAATLAVSLHLLGLRGALAVHGRASSWPRIAVASTVLVVIALHFLEIGLYAWLIDILLNTGRYGGLEGAGENPDSLTVFYFAAVAYTTLGFGDIVPVGAMRLISTVLPLTGMILVAFSASVIILVVQRSWAARSTSPAVPDASAEGQPQ
jgi:hypothetical protein